jgi:hypothetical protein
MDSEFWELEPSVGDLKSPSSLQFHLNVFTALPLPCSCSGNPSGFSDTPQQTILGLNLFERI